MQGCGESAHVCPLLEGKNQQGGEGTSQTSGNGENSLGDPHHDGHHSTLLYAS